MSKESADDIRNQLAEQFFQRVLDGTRYFASPQCAPKTEVLQPSWELQDIPSCRKCVLSNQRKRVVLQPSKQPKPILFLLDYPDAIDENAEEITASASAPFKLLERLEGRLHIQDRVHHSFAVKCVPKLGIPMQSVSACAGNLLVELQFHRPQMLMMFGDRARQAVEVLLRAPFFDPVSIGSLGEFSLGSQKLKLIALPSLWDLDRQAAWRAPVFDCLKAAVAEL